MVNFNVGAVLTPEIAVAALTLILLAIGSSFPLEQGKAWYHSPFLLL